VYYVINLCVFTLGYVLIECIDPDLAGLIVNTITVQFTFKLCVLN